MRDFKYAVGKIRAGKRNDAAGTFIDIEVALTFPASVPHDKMRYVFCGEPTSAGFFELTENGVHVFGHSETLGLQSRPEDATLIEKSIGFKRKEPA